MKETYRQYAADPSGHFNIEQCMRIVLRYATRTPTTAELMRDHGMSRSTAYRWVRAMKAAKGEY